MSYADHSEYCFGWAAAWTNGIGTEVALWCRCAVGFEGFSVGRVGCTFGDSVLSAPLVIQPNRNDPRGT
jgi:hypothetical protein